MRAPALFAPLLLALAGSLVACERNPEPTREWRPEDHQTPRGPATEGAPVAPSDDASREEIEARMAASLFRTNCASCHGLGGRGDGPGRPPGASVPDLTSEELQASRTHEQLAQVIAQGRGLMPGFSDRISPEGMALLVMHVRRLGAAAAAAPEAPAHAGTEGGAGGGEGGDDAAP